MAEKKLQPLSRLSLEELVALVKKNRKLTLPKVYTRKSLVEMLREAKGAPKKEETRPTGTELEFKDGEEVPVEKKKPSRWADLPEFEGVQIVRIMHGAFAPEGQVLCKFIDGTSKHVSNELFTEKQLTPPDPE